MPTPTQEELVSKKGEVEKRKLALEKYWLEIRGIYGKINEITYRQNSGIGISYEQVKKKISLQKELKSKLAELRRDYQVPPYRIPHFIRDCEHALAQINRQLEALEHQGREHRQQAAQEETAAYSSSLPRRQETGYDTFDEEPTHPGRRQKRRLPGFSR